MVERVRTMSDEQQCHKCVMEERVRSLEMGQTETRIYVKEIREDIQEIKTSLKNQAPPEQAKQWSPIVMELIKLVGTCVVILGAIVGAVKILGK